MKKLVSLLIVMIMVGSSLILTGDAASTIYAGEITAFSIASDSETTNPISTSNKAAIDALTLMLKNSGSVSAKTEGSRLCAAIKADTTDKSQPVTYNLLIVNQLLYIERGGSMIGISREAWDSFTATLDNSFYKYRSIPTTKLADTTLTATASDYAYLRVNQMYYKTRLTPAEAIPTVKVVAGKPLNLNHSATTEGATLEIAHGGEKVWSGAVADFSSFSPANANGYTAQLTANYKSDYYKGSVGYKFIPQFSGSADTVSSGGVGFSFEGATTYPGEVAVLRVTGVPSGADILFSSDIDFRPSFIKETNGDYTALVPVSYYTSVGEHYIKLTVGQTVESFKVLVNDKKFQIQNLVVDSTTTQETIDSKEANEEYERVIAPLRPVVHPTAYWRGTAFVWPVAADSRVTTQFGMIRYVNGQPTSVRHGAIDFAVPLGTRVNATNNGKVLYSGFLKLTGYTVLIEHGYGLKSWHYHMNSASVNTGDSVVAGQKIGEVGSTGFSTGPHLHFGMSVNNVFINPTTVINTTRLNFETK